MTSLAEGWLALECKMIAGVSQGLVVLGPPDHGPFVPTAHWPPAVQSTPELAALAHLAMSKRRAVVRSRNEADVDLVAVPFIFEEKLNGAVALEVKSRPDAELQALVQVLQWGAEWMDLLRGRGQAAPEEPLSDVIQLVALSLEQERFQAAATAVVTELAARLRCERVSLGFRPAQNCELRALSHSARFGKKTNLVRDLESAMDEALDQESVIVQPPLPGTPPHPASAHERLCRRQGASAVCTVPLDAHGKVIGGMTLERVGAGFDAATVELCKHLASLLGPILETKRRDDRFIGAKIADTLGGQLEKLVGPGHVTAKLVTGTAAAVLLFLALVPGTHRVSANATLEGSVQRAVAAAQEGFIFEATARAGDQVEQGQVLARLDDRDQQVERLQWAGQKAQIEKEYRGALAGDDRAQVSILRAQLAQADARLELLDAQLARTRMIAPFDGVVVSGDLSQSIGSPVERGQVLFEIAPLDGYRIILEVDERDVSHVQVGQRGELALSALPGDRLPLVVEQLTPVSVAEEGRNFFRVEAGLEEPSGLLRPGMEGVGKIEIGRRQLFWIWTHELFDWLRLWLWSRVP